MINRDDLKEWLKSHEVRPPLLFIENERNQTAYADPESEKYAPKLALCVKAWQASQIVPKGYAVSKWIKEYIKDHAAQYEIDPSPTMVDHLASIANWGREGGNKPTYDYVSQNIQGDKNQINANDTELIKKQSNEQENKYFLPSRPVINQTITKNNKDDDIPF